MVRWKSYAWLRKESGRSGCWRRKLGDGKLTAGSTQEGFVEGVMG